MNFQGNRSAAKIKNLSVCFTHNIDKKIINIDDYALGHVITNLIDNAIKYTYVGYIEVILSINDAVTIEVQDTGIGISKEYLPNIFSPFSQEEQGYSRNFEGNGLGLALVKKYCDIINADISVQSRKNEGTIFKIKLDADSIK